MSYSAEVYLAPMAGVTDRAFRELACSYGADRTYTEMVSAKGLYYKDKKTKQLLETTEREGRVAAQIFGHEPDIMASVVSDALSYGAQYLDINCGCPAKKIISNSDGGSLLKNPTLIGEIVSEIVKVSTVPVTVKIRTGWDDNSINAVETAKIIERNGASLIAIHGRTVAMGYTGTANRDIIKDVVRAVNIPVIANGDIFTPESARDMIEKTGCSGIMLGRGILGNPRLIAEVKHFLEYGEKLPPLSTEEKLELAKEHVKLIIKYKGEYVGIREARKHICWYLKGLNQTAKLKQEVTAVKTYCEMEDILNRALLLN